MAGQTEMDTAVVHGTSTRWGTECRWLPQANERWRELDGCHRVGAEGADEVVEVAGGGDVTELLLGVVLAVGKGKT